MSREEEILDALYDHTLDGEAEPVVELTNEALELGMDPLSILFDSLIPALEEVGRLFEEGEYFVPEMLVSARAMAGAMNILKPLIAESGAKPIGKFVMGTVKGDIHDIGKNLSAFLTTTMPMFKPNIEAIKEAGFRDKVKIFVGGAPVTQEYADTVGADDYAPDASSLVRAVKKQLGIS